MKFLKYILIFLSVSTYSNLNAQSGGCPCDPSEFEVPADYPDQPTADAAWAACLASYPECDETVPVSEYVYFLIICGVGYAAYSQKRTKLVFQKLKSSVR